MRRNTTKECPAAMSVAAVTAAAVSSSSLPERRTRRGPDASQNATPNRRVGEDVARVSWRSTIVLMKWDCPTMTLASSGRAMGTAENSMRSACARSEPRSRAEPTPQR